MKIIKYRKIFLGIALFFVLGSIAAAVVLHLNPGMEFRGGTMWQIKISADRNEVKNFLESGTGLKNFTIYSESETGSLIIRSEEISEADHQKYADLLKTRFGGFEELRIESIGPAIGNELKKKAIIALGFAIMGIALYVTFAFRKVSYPIKPWQYGLIVILTLLHDVAIPVGVFAVLNFLKGTEIDINFLTALLVIMGFSVNDTVVVFDRIRENLLKAGHRGSLSKNDLGTIIDASVKQTMRRSIFTNMTVMVVLASLFILGPVSLKNFIIALFVGVFFGTYSSVFVASPLLYLFYRPSKVDK